MTSVVVDASVALAWCFPDEGSGYADAVMVELKRELDLGGLGSGSCQRRIGGRAEQTRAPARDPAIHHIAGESLCGSGCAVPERERQKRFAFGASVSQLTMQPTWNCRSGIAHHWPRGWETAEGGAVGWGKALRRRICLTRGASSFPQSVFAFTHRAAAAFGAISLRRLLLSLSARARSPASLPFESKIPPAHRASD